MEINKYCTGIPGIRMELIIEVISTTQVYEWKY